LDGFINPLIEEVEFHTHPSEVFELFVSKACPFFLDSGMQGARFGRYSFMGAEPFLLVKTRGRQFSIIQNDTETTITGNPFDLLEHHLKTYQISCPPSTIPFTGGAVGYLSYDLCRLIETIPSKATDDLALPECYFGFYDVICAFDHLEKKAFIISTGLPETTQKGRLTRASERLVQFKEEISRATPDQKGLYYQPEQEGINRNITGNFSRNDYIAAVNKARQYIIEGDIFEVNLSQRFETGFNIHPFDLYKRLRHINPAPFAGYLDFGCVQIISASPERFLKLSGDRVETRPIKGTRPRGSTAEKDKALAKELLQSDKDIAENIMIVDLERNDLGRVCRYGSIAVDELAALEEFPTVFHLTSTISGQLQKEKTRFDLLKASFPGGSITGAPKIRAMEIIEELEPTRRSIYTGSIGYLGFNGDMDLNIAIRTIIAKDGKAYFQAGGAITYDSKPEAEYDETMHKAKALINALNNSLWQD